MFLEFPNLSKKKNMKNIKLVISKIINKRIFRNMVYIICIIFDVNENLLERHHKQCLTSLMDETLSIENSERVARTSIQ